MNKEEVSEHEGKPVRIVLKENNGSFYGTYTINSNSGNTIIFTDRYRKTFPIDLGMVGLIQPVDKINYIERGSNNDSHQ